MDGSSRVGGSDGRTDGGSLRLFKIKELLGSLFISM